MFGETENIEELITNTAEHKLLISYTKQMGVSPALIKQAFHLHAALDLTYG